MAVTKEVQTDTIRFGTGGIPLTTKKRNTTEGILRMAELGLSHMELEFVYSVYVKDKEVDSIVEAATENDIRTQLLPLSTIHYVSRLLVQGIFVKSLILQAALFLHKL